VKRWLFVLPLLSLMVACDQTSKRLAAELLEGLGPTPYLGGSVELLYVENAGAFLGLGARLTETTRFWLFTVGVSAGMVPVTRMSSRKPMAMKAPARKPRTSNGTRGVWVFL